MTGGRGCASRARPSWPMIARHARRNSERSRRGLTSRWFKSASDKRRERRFAPALCPYITTTEKRMTRLKLLGAAAVVFSSTLAGPAMAQQVVTNPGYCAQFYPNANCQNKGPDNPYTGDYQRRNAYRNQHNGWNGNNGWRDGRNDNDSGFWPAVSPRASSAAPSEPPARSPRRRSAVTLMLIMAVAARGPAMTRTPIAMALATVSSVRPALGSGAKKAVSISASRSFAPPGKKAAAAAFFHARFNFEWWRFNLYAGALIGRCRPGVAAHARPFLRGR